MRVMLFHGKAVKLLARITDKILISFEDARNKIPKAKDIILTGTPIKMHGEQLEDNQKKQILEKLKLHGNKPIVLIFGGSQGAKKINDSVVEILSEYNSLDYQIILSAGEKKYDDVIKELKERNVDIEKIENVKIFPYMYNMEEVEKIADILVCRSGATTIAEISIIGKPAILIPLPNVSNDHQMYNAKVLEKVSSAKIIKNDELNR